MATIMPSGISTSIFLRLWVCAPTMRSMLAGFTVRRSRGAATRSSPREIAGGERSAVLRQERGERAFENDVAAVFAGAGAEIDDVIGGAHHVGIVLDHDDGVAEVAQFFEDADEAAGVAGVQADGRLVEHVAGADQARAETGGELDALRFAAGERGGEAIEREVIEADVVEEFEALADLDEDFVGDGGLFGRECERAEEFVRLGDVHA